MKAWLWHLLGWVLIVLGVSAILGDLLGFDERYAPANWPFGAVVVALGAWALARSWLARRRGRKERTA